MAVEEILIRVTSPSGRNATISRDPDYPEELMLSVQDGREDRRSAVLDRSAAIALGKVLIEWAGYRTTA